MNFFSYAVVVVLLSSFVIDCVAMFSGAAAVSQHLSSSGRKGSGSSSGSTSDDGHMSMPRGYDAFMQAIQKGQLANAIMLLSQDRNLLNFQDPVSGHSPLIHAVLANKAEMVQFLLQQQSINKNLRDNQGFNALKWAQQMNYKKIIKLLKGEPVNLNSWWKRFKK